MVAIGPYYCHLPELQEMEEVKKAAVFQFCRGASWEAYVKVVAVANVARSCYDAGSLEGVSDADFASMMFHDACFLLATILAITKPEQCELPLVCRIGTNTPVVVTDMFLLENQIPWMVLEALMTFRKVDLCGFIATMGMNVQSRIDRKARPLDLTAYEPPHLLGLFHFYQSGREITFTNLDFTLRPPRERMLSSDVVESGYTRAKKKNPPPRVVRERARILESLPLGTSAIELAEIGIKLTLSKSAEFKDIGLTEGLLFRKLFLPSLRLNENTACWLVNMAAFETCVAFRDGDYTVSSYLVLFAMLMHREQDVHKLRAMGLIHGEFTNKQALDFFKGRHAGSMRPGYSFYAILRRLERYRQKRWLWIAVYKFVYNNAKTIATVLSIMGVLAGIFKALLDLKKQH
ncbi:hypothetical protein BRADI_3g14030v3 [Brachypodium distachyon]|uniref:Uncharacterized protein n=2 Tax=Brachypodium distachyon TaxID=15368 RepID=A0A2K2CX02_BRADI|nr:hypothetical protein BRADI_3g14030v3 [Brachypodium distachyon]